MRLIIFHYHLRPGGVRRIIELATAPILKQFQGAIGQVVLATGEAQDAQWNESFKHRLQGTAVEFLVEPALGYLSEQRTTPRAASRRIRAALERVLATSQAHDTLVWAHNLGIARNILLTREWVRICQHRDIPLIAHHHDWWFDNRWLRWQEMRRFGIRTLADAARAVFPESPKVLHLTINQADTRILQKHLGSRVAWLPNLTERSARPAPDRIRAASHWLQRKLGPDGGPVWLLPCRLLRRKNVAEALLLARWLRPEAWLVTTGNVSSAEEIAYARKLEAAARQHHWRLRLGVLGGDEAGKPAVAELLGACECVMLTSIQEGFGLPYIEAAAAGRPLIARSIPNVAPDLKRFGFKFPQYYDEVFIPPELFDWDAEVRRQKRLLKAWKKLLPGAWRQAATDPVVLDCAHAPAPVPFSRLTLTAQLEVLAQPVLESWARCVVLNPFLAPWRRRAAAGELQSSSWPDRADNWLSSNAYARRWARAVKRRPPPVAMAPDARALQRDFIAWKLGAEYQYPLLWSPES